MCFGLTNGLKLLLLFDTSSGPSLVKMSLWIQKRPLWEMQELLSLQLFLHLSPEWRRLTPRAGRAPGVRPSPGGALSHLLALVGHRRTITGVTSQGERRTRSTSVSFSGDRLQGARQARVWAGSLCVGNHVREPLVLWRAVAWSLHASGSWAKDVGGLSWRLGLWGWRTMGEEVVVTPRSVIIPLVFCREIAQG